MRRYVLAGVVVVACKSESKQALPPPTETKPAQEPADAGTRVDATVPHDAGPPIAITAGTPVLVFVGRDPWRMVIGSDEPALALYDNGALVCNAKDGRHAAMLDTTSRDALLASVAPAKLVTLPRYFRTSDATDQPTYDIHVWRGGCRSSIQIYGDPLSDDAVRYRPELPTEVLDAYRKLASYPCAQHAPWAYAHIEAMLWPFSGKAETTWPTGLPGLDGARTHGGDLVSIDVPVADRDKLAPVVKAGSTVLGGKSWSVSVRVPWPKEDNWMKKAGACPEPPRR